MLATLGALGCAGGMGSLSLATKREITKKYAREYATVSKKMRGRMLDELVATTGWPRANARRQVGAAGVRRGPQRAVKRAPRPRTYGYDTLKLLISVWMLAGQPSGKYLAATMGIWLPKLIVHGELDGARLNDHTRAQLLAVSGATIDRLLKPTRDGMRLTGIAGTRPGPLLRNSITVRKAGDEHEQTPQVAITQEGPQRDREELRRTGRDRVGLGQHGVGHRRGIHRRQVRAVTVSLKESPRPKQVGRNRRGRQPAFLEQEPRVTIQQRVDRRDRRIWLVKRCAG